MSPYRTILPPPIQAGPRWGVTFKRKLYVRVARFFFDIRAPYRYQRQYNQYRRDLADWKKKYENKPSSTGKKISHLFKMKPPIPPPPPINISE